MANTARVDEPHLPRKYAERWGLTQDGDAWHTSSSQLIPVRRGADAAILKIANTGEEQRGAGLMAWWNGEGAAAVWGRDGSAVLLERLEGTRSLREMVHAGHDADATRILCSVASRLHSVRNGTPPSLTPLLVWFEALLLRSGSLVCVVGNLEH